MIPEKSDHRTARRKRGSRGGRPTGFDKARYRARNSVERAINKLKQFRAVATRYDKRGYVYLGTVTADRRNQATGDQPFASSAALRSTQNSLPSGSYNVTHPVPSGLRWSP